MAYKVGPDRRRHILDGDRTGGGHRHGAGWPGKSEFPAGWDDGAIIGAVEAVANDPASEVRPAPRGRVAITGTHRGLRVMVVAEADGATVVTGYPLDVPRNPRGSDPR